MSWHGFGMWRGAIRHRTGAEMPARVGDVIAYSRVELLGVGSGGCPDFTARVEICDGVPQVREVTMTAAPGGRGLRTSDLDELEIPALLEKALVGSGALVEDSGSPSGGEEDAWVASTPHFAAGKARVRETIMRAHTSGRRRPALADLRAVARVYRENLERHPTTAVRDEFGYSYRTAARRVAEAREAGLLPATTSGQKRA